MEGYKKLNSLDLTNETSDVKDYIKDMDLHGARLRFKLRAKLTPTVKSNFKNDKKFMQQKWNCVGFTKLSPKGEVVGTLDTQEHIQNCEAHGDLKEGKTWTMTKILSAASPQ